MALNGPWGPLLALIGIFLSAGGLWSYLAARKTSKAADTKATTADWNALMTYWDGELKAVRSENKLHEQRIVTLEQLRKADIRWREADARTIEAMENHIMQQLPPPPPPRFRPLPEKEEDLP